MEVAVVLKHSEKAKKP